LDGLLKDHAGGRLHVLRHAERSELVHHVPGLIFGHRWACATWCYVIEEATSRCCGLLTLRHGRADDLGIKSSRIATSMSWPSGP